MYFKSIGLWSINYYFGIVLFYFLSCLLPIFVTFTVFLCTRDPVNFYRYSFNRSYYYFLGINIMFTVNLIFFGLIISLFFDNPNTANQLLKMICFVCNLSAIFLNVYHKPLVGKMFRFLPFFPYWSFIFNTETHDTDNLRASGETSTEVFTFRNLCIVSLFVQFLAYPFVFYYLKNIVRNEQDNKRHWLFFLKSSKQTHRAVDNDLTQTFTSDLDIRSLLRKRANRNISYPDLDLDIKSPRKLRSLSDLENTQKRFSQKIKLTDLDEVMKNQSKKSDDLVVKNLYKKYGDIFVLKNISETFKSGKISCILGHNGAGKSTLIKILSGLLARSSGEISFRGVPEYVTDRSLRMKIGIVTTENMLEEEFTVYQQLKVIAHIKNIAGTYHAKYARLQKLKEKNTANSNESSGLNKRLIDESLFQALRRENSEDIWESSNTHIGQSELDSEGRSLKTRFGKGKYIEKKVNDYLHKFNLISYKNKKISTLSDGVKKKLSIAMAFINNPKLLFLDEPTSIIDTISRKEIWNFIKEYK